ncbi:head-tail connector protein [Clostridium sp. B9]|uniref:head-tail connector protein n=1 Tax=Clostridium sp. B9 TaxID=3423224 RepID=UPI003D2ED2CD
MLEELKENLQISGNDEDNILEGYLNSSREYLNYIAGVDIDFKSSSFAKELLLERCRYQYNNAVEYFEINFKVDLMKLQLMFLGDVDV